MTPLDLGEVTTLDVINLLLGEKIGEGMYRDVYVMRCDPTKVVKIERTSRRACNAMEWEIWHSLQGYPDNRKWFAPCHHIGDGYCVLIQTRVTPVTVLPEKVPSYFTDFKLANWGKLPNGRVVCCDYANHLMFSNSFYNAKLKRLTKAQRARV